MGAWIETPEYGFFPTSTYVAPHVGAWIETSVIRQYRDAGVSHPMWVRGLKPHFS